MSGDTVEDLLYQGFQGRLLEESLRRMPPSIRPKAAIPVDVRAIVIARAMRQTVDGKGDLCCPGPMSPGPALAFGATPLEFLRHVTRKGTSPGSARAGGTSWTDLRRGLIGWDGAPGTMTQVLAGAALAFAQRGEDRAALVFERWSAIETGAWHEGMNFAAAQRAPVMVVVGPPDGRGRRDRAGIEGVARGYGVRMLWVGDDPLVRVFESVADARRRAVNGDGAVLIGLAACGDADCWAAHDAFVEWALLQDRHIRSDVESLERAAAAGVDHALGRIGKEPHPDPDEALAPVSTGTPPVRPWTRLESPRPDGVAGAEASGASGVH